MVAVDLARLRHQIEELIRFFEVPEAFHHALQGLFSLYANHSLRFGEAAPVRPLIPMYHLPHPVVRQLNLDLHAQVLAHPSAALGLADELWDDAYYEIKRTALFIIGELTINDSGPILDRISNWLKPELDQVLKTDLFSLGTRSLQRDFPQDWEKWVFSLLSNSEPTINAFGIQALTARANHSNLQNIPTIFRLVSRLIRNPQNAYINDLEDLIATLAKISPQETGFFLRQNLSLSNSTETIRLIKNSLDSFPPDIREELKAALD